MTPQDPRATSVGSNTLPMIVSESRTEQGANKIKEVFKTYAQQHKFRDLISEREEELLKIQKEKQLQRLLIKFSRKWIMKINLKTVRKIKSYEDDFLNE